PSVDEKPALLSRRGGAFYSEAAVELLASLYGTRPGRHVVNLRNDGSLPFLADENVVEIPAYVDRDGVRPAPVPKLDALYRGLVANVTAYEELALDAALRGGRERVFRALLAHPLIGPDYVAENLADKLIYAHSAVLPSAIAASAPTAATPTPTPSSRPPTASRSRTCAARP